MSITATRTGTITERPGTVTIGGHIGARVAGALLALAVASTHFADQGAAFPGTKEPGYVGVGYSIVEAVAVLAAILLLTRGVRTGWFLSLGVALGRRTDGGHQHLDAADGFEHRDLRGAEGGSDPFEQGRQGLLGSECRAGDR